MSQLTKVIFLIIIIAVFVTIIFVTRNPIQTAVIELFNKNLSPILKPLPTPISLPPSGFHSMEINEDGFNPSELVISKGEKVKFINTGSKPHWPVSEYDSTNIGVQICQEFKEFGTLESVLQSGESHEVVFNEQKTCPLYDKLDQPLKGKIIVR